MPSPPLPPQNGLGFVIRPWYARPVTKHHPLTVVQTSRTTSLLLCLAGLALSSASTLAQNNTDFTARAGFLSLRTGDVETATRANLLHQNRTANAAPLAPGMRYVVQFDGPLNDHKRALLKDCGITLGDYLPDSAYFADLSNANLSKAASLNFLTWAGAWEKSWKLEPEIGTRTFESNERALLARNDDVLVQAYTFAGDSAEAAAKAAARIPGAHVLDTTEIGGMNTVLIQLPRASVPALADIDSVRFVEEAPEFTNRSNINNRWIIQTNVTNSTPLYTAGIRGEGQIIGVMDDGFDPSHCSFSDTAVSITTANTPGTFPTHRKVVAYNVRLVDAFHGTHVSGTAMGNQVGDVNANTRGIAYNAKICFRTYSSPIASFPIDTHLTTHANQGATVHTNSWGDDGTTAYNAICRAIDLFSYNREDNLVCFASTNQSALKNPENAKSVFAVGKSGTSGSQTGSCSTLSGPTSDGRRKPEIFAPGCATLSSDTSTTCGTTSATGTSMASPAVAGAAALVRQYFTEGFYPTGARVAQDSFVPSGALLRAMIINSAVDMTSYPSPNQTPPNKFEGFGRILLDNSVYLAGDARKLLVHDIRNTSVDALATGNTSTFYVNVTSAAQPLEVTMAFTDAPATVPTSFAPVNNINLRVIDPSGNIYLGNVFNTTTGFSQLGGTADAINCIENTLFATPAVGQWKVEVSGAAVNVGKQGFGLVITGAVAGVNPCPADLNSDGIVDDLDFVIFSDAYAILVCTDPAMPSGCPANLNGDTVVDDLDFVLFAEAYEALLCP